jgi:hypothetical protein
MLYRSLGKSLATTTIEITDIQHRDLPRIAQKFLRKRGVGLSIAL